MDPIVPGLGEEETARRKGQQHFFRKVGFQPTAVHNEIYAGSYQIHIWSLSPMANPTATAAKALDTLYALQMPYEEYSRNVHIDVPEEENKQSKRA